jgi:DNA-binding MarR family transcriptional regulator/GNAT superfamily N-acetyltransferase
MDSGLVRQVQQVRQFNRTVTQRIGALNDAFLARARPLGQARLLWEIGPDGAVVGELRSRLGLDSGYVSRMLRSLEADGLIAVRVSADARARTVTLTAAGRAERATLDRISDKAAAAILAPLGATQRTRLEAAMAQVEQLLTASMAHIARVGPREPAARFCLNAYFAELAERFEAGFDPARSIPAQDSDLTPPAGLLLVATLHGDPVGCGALKFHPGAAAEIKRMWISPAVRGLGLGRRMLADLEDRARAAGAPMTRLETNRALTEAIALYRACGYREVPAFNDEPYAHHWFEKALAAVPER